MLYNLITRVNICKSGHIWCTDGSFIHPSEFKSSGKVAYGYALSNNKVVSIRRSRSAYKWSEPGISQFYQRITSAESDTDGVSNSNALKDIDGYSPINCPAIYVCLNYINAGINSYMPAVDELKILYYSIMNGKMKEDLIEAGLYEECNYSLDNASDIGWSLIWSSSQCSSNSYYNIIKAVHYIVYVRYFTKTNFGYVIPFFKF